MADKHGDICTNITVRLALRKIKKHVIVSRLQEEGANTTQYLSENQAFPNTMVEPC